MKADEFRVVRLLLEIVLAQIHRAVEIVEQFRDRLDPLIVLMGRRVDLLGFRQLAGLDGVRQLPCLVDQDVDLALDVDFVFRNRADQIHRRRLRRRFAGGRDLQNSLRIASEPAGHCVVAGVEGRGQGLSKARQDVLALVDDHDVFQDLPFDGVRAFILDLESGLAGGDVDLCGAHPELVRVIMMGPAAIGAASACPNA